MEILAFFQGLGEGDEEFDAIFNILEVDKLAGGVHVTQGNGEDASGDTATGHLDGAGIGAGRAGVGLDLVGNLVGFGQIKKPLKEEGVDVGTAGENGAFSLLEIAVFPGIGVGMVGGVADIHGNGDLRIDGE